MTRDFDLLWDFGKPEETEAKFRALLPKQPDDYARWELMTQIARCQGLQGNFEEALATLNAVDAECESDPRRQALLTAIQEAVRMNASGSPKLAEKMSEIRPLAEQLDKDSPLIFRVKVRSLLERGRTLNSSGKKDEAKPLFVQAFRLACDAGEDFFAIDAAHMVAITESSDKAMEWNLKGVAMAEASEDERARNWLGSLHNNIGWTQHDEGNYEEALASFQRALEHRVRQQKREPILIGRWCVARCLRSLGRVEEALQIQRDLLSARELESEPDMYVHQELAECLDAQGKHEEASVHRAKFEELRDRA